MITALAFVAVLLQGSAARSVELWSEHPITVTVEWLTIDARGAVTIGERRDILVGRTATLPYVVADGRFVRFSYPGASPRTFAAQKLAAYKRLRLPDVLPGGELFLMIPPAVVRPVTIDIRGPRVVAPSVTDASHRSLPGTPAGEYEATPVYAGGVRGAVYRVTVTTAGSTVMALPAEPVGAAHVIAGRPVCEVATEMSVSALVRVPHDTRKDAPPARARLIDRAPARCDAVVGGLAPGRYEVSYAHRLGSVARTTFDIEAQRVSPVHVGAPTTRVSGRLTLNGKPISSATLRFIFSGAAGAAAGAHLETVTDAGGFYSVLLASPGLYSVVSMPSRALLVLHERVDAKEGDNTFDIALQGGSLTVQLSGWDGLRRVSVRIEGAGRMSMLGWGAGDSTAPRTFHGLPFGEYTVSLAGASAPPSQSVRLTAERPDATVTVSAAGR